MYVCMYVRTLIAGNIWRPVGATIASLVGEFSCCHSVSSHGATLTVTVESLTSADGGTRVFVAAAVWLAAVLLALVVGRPWS